MTNIRIPLKTKVRSIKNLQKKNDDPEIKDSEELTVKLNRTSNESLQSENSKLLNKITILEESLQQAREETFLSGIEEGKEQLRNEMEQVIENELNHLKKIISKITSEFDKEIKNLNKPILSLAKEIAKRIIDNELKDEEKYNELLVTQISKILHEMMDQEIITIHVAPKQMEWIMKYDIEKELNIPDKIKIKFYEDRTLNAGECILESSNLLIEGTFQTQLTQIENQLSNL